MNIMAVDLHIVYIETVINMKLQFDRPMSNAVAKAGKRVVINDEF